MMAWMNAETLQLTLDEGRMVYWSRSRQEVWRKGDTSGDAPVRARGVLRLRRRRAAVPGRAGGQGRLPHRRAHVLLPPLRRRLTRSVTHAHPPDRDEFRALAGEHTVVPVWTELLADLETPVAAYAKLVGDGAGLPARVGRARRALEPLLVRRPRPGGDAGAARRPHRASTATLPPACPLDRGMLAALDALLRDLPGADASPTCRRCRAG